MEDRLTVTVLASISVNMNSPPSKSPFRYNSALGERMRGSEPTQTESGKDDGRRLLGAPVVSVGVGWRLLPALVGLGVQQTVVGVDGVTQVISVVLLAC